MVYLDYAANSPVDKEVLDVFNKINNKYIGNPNSSHKLGREAKNELDIATKLISTLLKVKESEIIYTSGASESNNLAIKGILNRYKNKGKHIIVTTLDHPSVTGALNSLCDAEYEIDIVDILDNGLVDIDHLKELLREDTLFVSVPYVDSEVGIKQPIEEIGLLLKEKYPDCYFFTDAAQAAGKINIDITNVDLMTISPHKFYGLNGIGILIKKDDIQLTPLIHGGKSTTIYRSGTPDLALVASTAKALEIAYKNMDDNYTYVEKLNYKVRNNLVNYKNVKINSTHNAIPYTLNISIKGIKAIEFVEELEKHEVYVSVKTACCPTNTISRSVYALTNDKKLALSAMRISLSHLTTDEEINRFLDCFKICYDRLVNETISGRGLTHGKI